jgi:hypothetical protein
MCAAFLATALLGFRLFSKLNLQHPIRWKGTEVNVSQTFPSANGSRSLCVSSVTDRLSTNNSANQ